MMMPWYKAVKNADTKNKRVGDLTNEELETCIFYLDMADRWTAEERKTMDALTTERRMRRK